MDKFLIELKIAVNNFLVCLIHLNVHWTNKPKFHMLIHLVKSIATFAPTPLFATELFESYNTVLHEFSIHSNQQVQENKLMREKLFYVV
ncbi:hypothetical protein CROQUDRAFT_45688 [Cronartium quercuum f. sp. fusiforme G11]|uniref:Uncharacterized protein n=1 Tax=Cronartium quercuum f. sp. fusiforme G11 TaxID=708437 RepID=A0A9P6TCB6_9BASI|nr:hypothetical protein CROQUDRAFT_45688 [Cronartium quercuum f. sp. fusiforme G11]